MSVSDDVLAAFAASASRDLGQLFEAAARTANTAVFQRVLERGHPLIRPSHVPVFAGLEMGGTRISVLAAKAGVSRQAMGVTVREVEALGYITLSPDPSDARATLVTLTDLGVDFCVKGSAASAEVNNELDALLGRGAAQRLRTQLRSVISSDLG